MICDRGRAWPHRDSERLAGFRLGVAVCDHVVDEELACRQEGPWARRTPRDRSGTVAYRATQEDLSEARPLRDGADRVAASRRHPGEPLTRDARLGLAGAHEGESAQGYRGARAIPEADPTRACHLDRPESRSCSASKGWSSGAAPAALARCGTASLCSRPRALGRSRWRGRERSTGCGRSLGPGARGSANASPRPSPPPRCPARSSGHRASSRAVLHSPQLSPGGHR